ncbi:PREDICTED: solute carrier organic anion transporter family member 4C1-like [Diuraphis noxia]|uniref:solute carrier organic anion transporter family member 4C1-like n=1 Tax=Diuraphis noxia TaxID=143948 RepID=UPI000763ACC4|nr:PREDICTED: solute carrier organic anion transporter family member 4C1-like [Diuraphis noxia]
MGMRAARRVTCDSGRRRIVFIEICVREATGRTAQRYFLPSISSSRYVVRVIYYNKIIFVHTTCSTLRGPRESKKMSKKTSDDPADVENTVCGIWLFKPKWLQIFASKKVYVLVYGLLGLNQFMLSSYFNGTLTTMEKRFKFSSQMSGIISSTWDLFSLISFMVTSHMAGKGHRTRWLAIGSFLVGLSCFVRLLPHIIYGPGEEILQYTVEYGANVNSTSLLSNISRQNEKICDGQPLYEDCNNEQLWNVAAFLFCAAHAMLGLGGSLYWTCGAAYLDDNVRKNSVPVLLGKIRKLKEPEEKKELVLTDFKTSLKRILSNKILVFNSASNSFFVLGLIGYWTFMPKYMETQFRQTAANSNFASGAIGILSSGLGIVTSGLVISKFKPSPRSLAMWNFIAEALEVVGHLAYIFLGCAAEDLHGQWNADKTWNLTMDCNVGCNCGKSMNYNPVCSFDGSTTFYSPCYAGCTLETIVNGSVKAYSNCTCIGGLGTATEGGCPVACGHDFIIFLALMGVMRFLSSTGRSGNTIIQFRSVRRNIRRFFEIGHATCMVWGGNCGTEGNCWLYDGKRLKYYLNFTGASFLLIGTILDIGVWYHVKDLKIYDDSRDEKSCEKQ